MRVATRGRNMSLVGANRVAYARVALRSRRTVSRGLGVLQLSNSGAAHVMRRWAGVRLIRRPSFNSLPHHATTMKRRKPAEIQTEMS